MRPLWRILSVFPFRHPKASRETPMGIAPFLFPEVRARGKGEKKGVRKMKMMMLIGFGILSVAAQCATVAELKTMVANKEKEITELRKTNPACLVNPNAAKTIRNREIKMIDREHAKYYRNKNIIFIRETFWCTKCKAEFDVESGHERCPAAKASFPLWRDAYNNLQKTQEVNRQLDVLFGELNELKEELKQAKKIENEQKLKDLEAKRKTKKSQTGK